MKKNILCLILLVFGISLYAAPVWEAPSCITQNVSLEWKGSSAETMDGNVIYVWSDIRTGVRNIYAQKFSIYGTPLWANPVLIDNAPGEQSDPLIVKTSFNNFVICWYDMTTNPEGDIYAQSITQSGLLLWTTGGHLVCSSETTKSGLQLVAGVEGACMVVWADVRNSNSDIYGQYMDFSGANQWGTNGKQLTYLPASETEPIAVSDTGGGFLLGYKFYYLNAAYSFLMRYDANGNMAWVFPVQIEEGSNLVSLDNLVKFDSNSFVYTYHYGSWSSMNVKMQKIDRNGNLLWQNPVQLLESTDATSANSFKCAVTIDSKIIVTWEKYSEINSRYFIAAQKISALGLLEWAAEGVAVTANASDITAYSIINDLNGGVYVVWQNYRSNEFDYGSIYAQNLNANGTKAWGETGKLVTIDTEQNSSLSLHILSIDLFIIWSGKQYGISGIATQLYNSGGDIQLMENGKFIFSVLNSQVENNSYQVIHRSNDTIIFWRDFRGEYAQRIYYQIIDANGNAVLEANGRLLTPLHQSYQGLYAIAMNDNDQVAIIWEDYIAFAQYQLYAQLIDVNGDKLWGENGILLTSRGTGFYGNPMISFDDGAFYFGWTSPGENDTNVLHAQKVINNQLQWGEGINVSNPNLPNTGLWEPLMSGRYFVWVETGNDYRIKVKLINPDGTTADGWPEEGRRVDEYISDSIYEMDPFASSDEQGVYISWTDRRIDFEQSTFAQHISPQGLLTWDEDGVQINSISSQLTTQILGNGEILFTWASWNNNASIINATKYDVNGNLIFSNIPVFNPITYNDYNKVAGCQFENNSYLISVVDPSPIHQLLYTYIDSAGNINDPSSGITLSDQLAEYSFPVIATNHHEAYITWLEAVGYEFKGLYLQKLNNETVGIDDPSVPSVAFTLEQNYPNPFNPETTIKYTLPSQSAVKLDIYNIKGQKITTLVNEKQISGSHSIKWNGKDDANKQVASGVYFYRLDAGSKSITKKMVLLK